MSDFTAAGALKSKIYEIARDTIYVNEEVQVSYGHPGQTQTDDIVGIGDTRVEQEPANLSTNRSREEIIRCDVIVSVFRRGGPEQARVASDRAFELVGMLEGYVRYTDTTLGGTVRHCFLESLSEDGTFDDRILSEGRLVEITATFVAANRVTT